MASWVKCPCTYRLFDGPEGCPPLAPWNRQTFHPFTAGARHWHLVRFDCAEHCCAFGKTQLSFMGLTLRFCETPLGDIADDGLSAWINVNVLMLDNHPLLSLAAVAF